MKFAMNTVYISPMQLIREFDRIHKGIESKRIIELWENLIPTIAEGETTAAIASMIDGAEDFSEGIYTMSYRIAGTSTKFGRNGSPFVLAKFKFGDLNTYRHRCACMKFNWRVFNLAVYTEFAKSPN